MGAPEEAPLTGEVVEANTVDRKVDAKDRAWRTFIQNIRIDLVVALAPILVGVLQDDGLTWSKSYWLPVAISIGKTAALVVLAYWMRMRKPPVGAEQ